MKQLLTLFALLALCFSLPAQSLQEKFNIQSGKLDEGKAISKNYLGKDENGNHIFHQFGVALFYKTYHETIYYYDDKLNLISQKEIDFPPDQQITGDPYVYEETYNPTAIEINNQHYLIRSNIQKEEKKVILNAYKPDPKTGLTLVKNIFTLDNERYRFQDRFFSISLSPDGKKIAFIKKFHLKEKYTTSGYLVFVTDDKFNILWQEEIIIPIYHEYLEAICFKVRNDDSFIMLIKEYFKGATEVKNNKPNFAFHIISKKNKGQKAVINKFQLEDDKLISKPVIVENHLGDYVVAGFYGAEPYQQEGVFISTLDNEGLAKTDLRYEFPKDFVLQTLSKEDILKTENEIAKGKKNKYMEEDLLLYEILSDKKGGFYITGEKFIRGVYGTSSATHYLFIHTLIWAIHCDTNKEVVWSKKIYKYNMEQFTSWSNNSFTYYNNVPYYYPIVESDAIYFLYDDEKKRKDNLGMSSDINLVYTRNYALWVAKLDASTGDMNKAILEDMTSAESFINNFSTVQEIDNTLYWFGLRYKTLDGIAKLNKIQLK